LEEQKIVLITGMDAKSSMLLIGFETPDEVSMSSQSYRDQLLIRFKPALLDSIQIDEL
jgi:hypothetical protein